MDLTVFADMEAAQLREYIQFLLWHYRVMDSFWYIAITELLDEETADRLNEKVWGIIPAMGARDLVKRFHITVRAWRALSRPCVTGPGRCWWGIRSGKRRTKSSSPSPPAPPRKPGCGGACRSTGAGRCTGWSLTALPGKSTPAFRRNACSPRRTPTRRRCSVHGDSR